MSNITLSPKLRQRIIREFTEKIIHQYGDDRHWLRTRHLIDIPELKEWLLHYYSIYFDRTLDLDDILELVLNHFYNAVSTPELFRELAIWADAPRKESLLKAEEMLTRHLQGNCSCSSEPTSLCPAGLYLDNRMDIRVFMEWYPYHENAA